MSKSKNPKPTLIDFVILGLIQNHPHTGYQIRKVFETTALGSQAKSPGTIYPALSRLQKLEYVENIEEDDSGKTKYQITKRGIDSLIKWLTKPIEIKDVEGKRDELFLRFAFMGTLVEDVEKINFLKNYQHLLTNYIEKRQTYISKDEYGMPLTAKLVFEYGTDCQKLALKWCINAIKEFNN
jgi:DNA-binding PadR family transcriptional regulator